ncbi:integrase, catalytic region, zinc finger, CCHC-type containing protein [Tanacetum coccineum]|uniref:Integrase, catalytic region, zinc finger, CCHC-type containing protein n=1 Tax=Tanacetum coccineum TaxID=301880 RepID=A0ABQ5DZ87_9ASTR
MVRFGNDHFAAIMGYGDLQMRNILISRVYYVEGLGHDIFSIGQFCDSDLEVAFIKHTCFVRNLEGVDLLSGSRGYNLYTISMADMMRSSPICLLSKASKTKSWLWHRRLSHLNFGTINQLAKQGLVKFLRTKDEAPEVIVKFLKQAQVSLNATVRYLFERRNRMLVEDARTMLIFSKSPIFLWAEAVATACYTQNRSLIHVRYNKTPYELLGDGKPKLRYLHIFCDRCFPTNDFEDLKKLQSKADIEIFNSYSPSKKAYIIYNKRTRQLIETMNIQFDKLTQMASEQPGSGPELQGLTFGHISSGLVLNQAASTSAKTPTKNDWDLLFQPMFDEYFKFPSVVSTFISAVTRLPSDTAEASSSTSIDKVAQSILQMLNEMKKLQSLIMIHLKIHLLLQTPAQLSYLQGLEPKNFKEAMIESSWIEATQEEIHEFKRLKAWELVLRPDIAMIISLKWIFKAKLNEYSGVLKNKAQLVTKVIIKKRGLTLKNRLHLLLALKPSEYS